MTVEQEDNVALGAVVAEKAAKSATISDVAAFAGVSKKTVSRVINDEPYVTELKVELVRKAIRELNFVPNASAQRLRHGRSLNIAALYSSSMSIDTWLSGMLGSLNEACSAQGYRVFAHTCDLGEAGERELSMPLINEGSADGVILLPPYGKKNKGPRYLIAQGIPFVQIESPELSSSWPSISVDNKRAAADMTEFLVSNGHRRIGFIKGNEWKPATQRRLAGHLGVLESHGIEANAGLIKQGDFTFESGLVNGRQLLMMNPRPTAIFASNDVMAAGVLLAAHQMGLSVPADVSVSGFDDIVWARRIWPPLTTVRQPMDEIARVATDMLIRKIKGELDEKDYHPELSAELIVRESTGPAA